MKLARTSVSLSKAVLLIFMDLEAWVVWVNIPLPAPCHQCSTDGCGVAHCSLNTCYNASLCHFFISSIDGSAGFHLAVNFYWKQFSSFLCPFCLTSERKSQSLEVWVGLWVRGVVVKFFLPFFSPSFHVSYEQSLQFETYVTCSNTFLGKNVQ